MLVECNAVVLVGNYVAKIPQFSKYFLSRIPQKDFCQISKVSTDETEY